jgi:hypothetical protein
VLLSRLCFTSRCRGPGRGTLCALPIYGRLSHVPQESPIVSYFGRERHASLESLVIVDPDCRILLALWSLGRNLCTTSSPSILLGSISACKIPGASWIHPKPSIPAVKAWIRVTGLAVHIPPILPLRSFPSIFFPASSISFYLWATVSYMQLC